MATIKIDNLTPAEIDNLTPAGVELFFDSEDSESFMNELNNDELEHVQGGYASPVVTGVCNVRTRLN